MDLPVWVKSIIDKGGDVGQCIDLFKQMQESMEKAAEREAKAEALKRDERERAAERAERMAERELKKAEMEREVRLKELEVGSSSDTSGNKTKTHVKFELPRFVEGQDIDVFLTSFERLASLHKWPKTEWALRLVPQLSGRALEAYSRLGVTESSDYEVIKKSILMRYGLTSWAYREKFRGSKQFHGEMFKEYTVRVIKSLERWQETEKVGSDYHKLNDLLVREQLLFSSPQDLQIYLKEREPATVDELVKLAEAYQQAHKNIDGRRQKQPGGGQSHGSQGNQGNRQSFKTPVNSQSQRSERRCFLCNSKDHLMSSCPNRTNKHAYNKEPNKFKSPTVALLHSPRKEYVTGATVDIPVTAGEDNGSDVVSTVNGINLTSGQVNGKQVTILRDTGSSTIFVSDKFVLPSQKTSKVRDVTLADGTVRSCPEAMVDLDTPFITGKVSALVMNIPIADLVIGNKGQMQVPEVQEYEPEVDQSEKCQAVQTRSQKQAEMSKEQRDRELEELRSGNLEKTIDMKCITDQVGGKETLRLEQNADVTLDRIKELAQDVSQRLEKSYFVVEDGILFRYFKSKSDENIRQVVVPEKFRAMILSVAHEVPLGGHLGTAKTRDRILQHFFWPGLFVDVSNFCKSCPQCQKSMSRGRVGKAPLIPIPPMDEPFQRVAIDIVGPLPRTDRGNKYILVACDYGTKYPEAIPLKSIDAESVADALVEIFSRVGVPKEILSDQGSNFMSSLMQELCRLLHIKKMCSSPYHPQANGLVEKFNGTLKKMLRCYCQDNPGEWDRYIPYVLFSYREVPQDSSGFSPFELLYGRNVRGPLSILKEQWEEPEGELQGSVLSYILDARDKLAKMTDIASENELSAKRKQKLYFDRKARNRNLEPGNKVLVLLPTSNSKLLAQWKGPYEVLEKVGPVDYKINVKGRSNKVFHINMLKPWIERESLTDERADVINCLEFLCALNDQGDDFDDVPVDNPLVVPRETVEDVQINDELTAEQKTQIQSLCQKYSDVLTDIPGKTDLVVHSIKLKDY